MWNGLFPKHLKIVFLQKLMLLR